MPTEQGSTLTNLDVETLYNKFLLVHASYGDRDAVLDALDLFFNGVQWEDNEEDREDAEEEVRVTLNYTQLAVLRQVAYLISSPVRADVLQVPGDSAARRRESFLRSLLTYKHLWGVWANNVEMDANEYSYAVVQAMWAPPDKSVKHRSTPDTAGTPQTVYSRVPFKFRAIDPKGFIPLYRTYDEPDDFLYVYRYEAARLVEDLEDTYGVRLQAMAQKDGTKGTCEVIEYWDKTNYVLFAVTSRAEHGHIVKFPTELKREKHKYPRIPFFVVQNIRIPHKNPVVNGSLSDVQLLKDMNKHLNLVWTMAATEILTRMRPPTVYKSDTPSIAIGDIRMGAGEVIGPIKTDEEIIPLDWAGLADTVKHHSDDTMAAIADIGGLPRTDLGSGGSASGIGMRLAYANLELVLALKVPQRTTVLEAILSFCMEVLEDRLGENGTVNYSFTDRDPKVQSASAVTHQVQLIGNDIAGQWDCTVAYPNLIPRDKLQYEQHAAYLANSGLISRQTALEMLSDIADPETELDRLRGELQDPILNPEAVIGTANAKAGAKPQPQPQPRPGAGVPAGAPTPELMGNEQPPLPITAASPVKANTNFLQRQPVTASGLGMPQNAQMPATRPGVYQGPPMTEAF